MSKPIISKQECIDFLESLGDVFYSHDESSVDASICFSACDYIRSSK